MNLKSKIVLFIISMLCSRALFLLVDDPEGPNLLIVTMLAVILYFLFSRVYLYICREK